LKTSLWQHGVSKFECCSVVRSWDTLAGMTTSNKYFLDYNQVDSWDRDAVLQGPIFTWKFRVFYFLGIFRRT